MQVNTNTGEVKPTVTELRQLEKSRKFLIQLAKHADDALQEDAAKAVGAINKIQLVIDKIEAEAAPEPPADDVEAVVEEPAKSKKKGAAA